MDYHYHARLTIYSRELLAKAVVEGRLGLCEAAAAHRLSRQSASKWVRRYREAGRSGLRDRSSRPQRSPRRTSSELVERVERLRRERWTGIRIAQQLGLSQATVSRILTRLQLNRRHMLEAKIPVVRYEHAAPGDLLHLDIKKLARIVKPGHRITGDPKDETRGAGWEFLTLPSTITRGWLLPPCTGTKKPPLRQTSCDRPSLTSSALASAPAACLPTTVLASMGANFFRPVAISTSLPSALGPTRHGPTAKQSGSSRPPSGNGLTLVVTKTQPSAATNSSPGPTVTTGIVLTPAWIRNHLSADPVSMSTTS